MDRIEKLMLAGICGLVLTACGGGGGDGNDNHTITASAGAGGSISPAGATSVTSGTAGVFTITPDTGYSISSVGGTCGGTLSGNTYTTNAVNADCTVDAEFTQGTIAACFTVPGIMSFEVSGYDSDSGMPVVGGYIMRSVGPGAFNGQTATESASASYTAQGVVSSSSMVYWAVADSGVSLLGQAYSDGTSYVANPAPVIPLNMLPGQSVNLTSSGVVDANFDAPASSFTFVGFETLTLANKTFSNVCHFQLQGTPAGSASPMTNDFWYAPGYGEIQTEYPAVPPLTSATVFQYSGDSVPPAKLP